MVKRPGSGAVSIWTHHMKQIDFVDYTSTYYTGRAAKVGAGVLGIDAYKAAHDQGLVAIGGNCPTVGLAGGYTQGGGTSPLTSRFGMAADQVLEWEVVPGAGELLRTAPDENEDLYLALAAGGGGTYGVVVPMTSRV